MSISCSIIVFYFISFHLIIQGVRFNNSNFIIFSLENLYKRHLFCGEVIDI
jgi:hypothetical protein